MPSMSNLLDPKSPPSILEQTSPASSPGELFYGTRGNFRRWDNPQRARIAIIGESWGSTEHQKKLPFVGKSGEEMEKILQEAGLPATGLAAVLEGFSASDSEYFLTNVVSEQPPGNNMHLFFYPTAVARKNKWIDYKGLFPRDNVRSGIERLKAQLRYIRPDIIIGFGNYALWALTNNAKIDYGKEEAQGWLVPTGIGNWRGSQLFTDVGLDKPIPFLPTYHPATVFQTWAWRYLIKHDLKARAGKFLAGNIQWQPPERNFIIRPDSTTVIRTLHWLLAQADAHAEFGCKFKLVNDLETRNGLIACIGFGWSKRDAICIPLMCVERPAGYFSVEEEALILPLVDRLLRHPGIHLVGQNFIYDSMYYAFLPPFTRMHIGSDTMVKHHVCWPGGGNPLKKSPSLGMTRKGLDHLSSIYCEHHVYWKDESKNWDPALGEDQLWIYNCTDCIRTYEVDDELDFLVAQLGLIEQFQEKMDYANELALPMMIEGLKVDLRARANVAMELSECVVKHERKIDSMLPHDVYPRPKRKRQDGSLVSWVASDDQQKTIFYDILGVKPVISRKSGNPTTDKNALPIIAKRQPLLQGVVDELLKFRKYSEFHEACNMALDYDGRLRCSYSVAGTETHRWNSTKNPFGNGDNLQNISKGTEDDPTADLILPNMRKFIVPDPGHEIVEFDLSGADAQVVAWEAEDEDLKLAFRKGLKLHIKNARDVYPQARNMTDDELKHTDHPQGLYGKCKRFVHGSNYGGSPKGMAGVIGCAVREVQEFQDIWFSLHPGIRGWQDRTGRCLTGEQCWNCWSRDTNLQRCNSCGASVGRTVGNRFGYRIVYFDRVEGLLPQALAWIPQSTVAIVCTRGMLRVARKHKWFHWRLQVHDSGAGMVPLHMRAYLKEVKQTLYSVVVPYKDPLVIPWGCQASSKSWGHIETIPEWKTWNV